jgi:predicted flap endonuclease-1-like 5' DNA nuclease
MNLCILIPAIVGLVCGILGYLLGSKFGVKVADSDGSLQMDLDQCRANTQSLNAKIRGLEADLDLAKSASSSKMQSFAADVAEIIPFDAAAAFAVFGKKVKQDDLKIVEGIGPKIEEHYHSAGIKTWKALSETTLEKSQSILDAAGDAYKIHNPSTWSKQAKLAYEGKWQELKDWQDQLDGGKE